MTLKDKIWFDWQKRTAELPPDFKNMPSIPFLPNPLILQEGAANIPIQSPEQWDQKKSGIKNQVQHWLTGTFLYMSMPTVGFGRRSADFVERYLKAGFAVLTMDMIGFNS